MSVAIRLMRFGKKHYPTYRIIVTQKHSKRDGAYIESIGVYDPNLKENTVTLQKDRLTYWLSVGAQMSEGLTKMKNLLEKAGDQPKEVVAKEEVTVKKAPAKKATAKPAAKKTTTKKAAK